jgi:hypothetical protein
MPIFIDELIVEAEPPRFVQPQAGATKNGAPPSTAERKKDEADRMLELSIAADRLKRIEVD